ncbi:hypothetical protein BKA93DRAFT_724935, partial [Sparassis latifolia]
IIFSHIKVGGYNGEQFIEYIQGLLEVMNPYPGSWGGISIRLLEVKFLDRPKTDYCESICQGRFH